MTHEILKRVLSGKNQNYDRYYIVDQQSKTRRKIRLDKIVDGDQKI